MFKNKFHFQMSWPEIIVEMMVYVLPGIAAVSVGASLLIEQKVDWHDIVCVVASCIAGLALFEVLHPRGVACSPKDKTKPN